jgi:hypothetical protein
VSPRPHHRSRSDPLVLFREPYEEALDPRRAL